MAETLATKTSIDSIREDGSIHLSVKFLGLKMECRGSCGVFEFSTKDKSSKIGKAFKHLANKPFNVVVGPNGDIQSISNLQDKLTQTEGALPNDKANKDACNFLKSKILSKSYFRSALAVGWTKVNPDNLEKGDTVGYEPSTPPLSGANPTHASFSLVSHEEKGGGIMGDGGSNHIYKCKAGIASGEKRGIAQFKLGKSNRMVRKLKTKVDKKKSAPGSGGAKNFLEITFERKET